MSDLTDVHIRIDISGVFWIFFVCCLFLSIFSWPCFVVITNLLHGKTRLWNVSSGKSFEAFELEITVNFPVHTWTENGSFTRNLTSWSTPFWLVLITEHKVLHCYAPNAFYRSWLPDNNTHLADSLQQTVDASKFPTLIGQLLNSLRAPYCFDG